MMRCRRYLLALVAIATCLFFLQLGMNNWNYNFVVKTPSSDDKNVVMELASVRAAIESVSTTDTTKTKPSHRPVPTALDLRLPDEQVKPNPLVVVVTTTAKSEALPSTRAPITATTKTIPAVKRNHSESLTVARNVTANGTISKSNLTSSMIPPRIPLSVNTTRISQPNGDSLVRKPRNKLKFKTKPLLTPEQTLRILGNAIAALPVVPPQKAVRVLVATYFRSGSTFLGDILQQNWKTFYHFEPLHYMSDGLRIKPNQTEEALALLRDIFTCNFNSSVALKYLKWGEMQQNQFLFKRNRFLWVACRMQPKNCFRPDFARYICERAPIQVMKVTRLFMEDVKRLVDDNPDLDIRVVNLVRDPRGTISSRKVLQWCNTTKCSDFRVLCAEMNQDYDSFQKLVDVKPNRFYQIRYEDLSRYPEQVTRKLFASLGLPYSTSVDRFLRTNTKARPVDQKDPYSTRRDSSKTPFEWRRKMTLNEIKKIQIGCKNVLINYRYDFLNKTGDLRGMPPVLMIRDRPWWIRP